MSQQWTYVLELQESEMEVLETALSHCLAGCRQEDARNSMPPVVATEECIANIRRKFEFSSLPWNIPPDSPHYLYPGRYHFTPSYSWKAVLEEAEMMALDVMLSHYLDHYRRMMVSRLEDESYFAPDTVIERIRQQRWAQPPMDT